LLEKAEGASQSDSKRNGCIK